MSKFLSFAFIIFIFTACHNSANHRETNNVPSTTPVTPINTNIPSTPVSVKTDTALKEIKAPAETPTNSAPAKTTTATRVVLNPAHGQPGHRCDIPEGTPLNNPAVTNATTPANNKNVTTPASQPQAPVKSKVKLNPAHGQPGHDCSIGVGQPLKT